MTSYNLQNPFYATVKERLVLNKNSSKNNTYKIIIDIKNSGLTYQSGDSLAVIPENHPKIVSRCIEAMHAKKETPILTEKGSFTLEEFLTKKANITRFQKKLLKLLLEKADSSLKKDKLSHLLKEENKDELKIYMESHELWDMLQEFMSKEIQPVDICSLLLPLFPRLYSISSSQSVYKDEVHLTVALVTYKTSNQERFGVASHYLCQGKNKMAIYIHHANNFGLPKDDNAPIIMVGPGVGIAPFISFLQQRFHDKSPGKNWLFFGEQNRASDFYYEDFFLKLQNLGFLKLDLAFSRDQSEKIYVQHKMLEKAQELWQWLENGAYFYVCGNAAKMAKEVEATLKTIIQNQGLLDEESALHYLNELRAQKRYLRDVY